MTGIEITSLIVETGVIPIVRATTPEKGLEAAQAVCETGIPIIEVTMTVPGALRIIEKLASQLGGKVLLGAGTILDPETARAAILEGAEFLVTPTLNTKVIEMAKRYSKAILPGALTPTEILTAWEAGADLVKVFPVGSVGGPKYIKALKAPLPQIRLAAVGGVNLETATEYLLAGASALGVGSELVDAQALASGRLDVIQQNARKFMACVSKAREKAVPA